MNRISDCGIECKYLRIGYFNVKYIELIYIPINLYKEILYKDIYENIMILRVKMVTSIDEKSEYHIVKSCKCNIDMNNNSEKSNGETDVFQLSEDSIITRKRL